MPHTVWVLRRWDRHEDVITLWASEEAALEDLARDLSDLWGNVSWRDEVPKDPPTNARKVVSLYYGPQDGWDEEGYCLYPEEVNDAP